MTDQDVTLQHYVDCAIEDLKNEVDMDWPQQDMNDTIWEITDQAVPIYTWDILTLARGNHQIGIVQPEIMPEEPTPEKLAQLNIFDEILMALTKWHEEWQKERIEEMEQEVEEEDEEDDNG